MCRVVRGTRDTTWVIFRELGHARRFRRWVRSRGRRRPATPETQALLKSLAVDEQRLSAFTGRGGDALRQRASRAVHVRPHAKASTVGVLEYVKTAELARTAASPVQAHLNVTLGFAAAPLVDELHSARQTQLDVPDL